MRSLVCASLTLVSLTATLMPAVVQAQSPAAAAAPAGYAAAPVPVVARKPASAAAAPAPHTHKGLLRGRTVCANCAKKEQAAMQAQGPMMEQIVACEHSKNGACASCRALLAMPGAITVGAPAAPGAPAEAPGRAVASSSPAPTAAPAQGAVAAVYDPSQTPEPAPIGVMQTNYAANPSAAPAPAAGVPTAASITHGQANADRMGAAPAPFQHKPTSSKNPRIIGHLLGITGIGSEYREQRAQRKSEAHASIPYNNEGTTVNEVPASVIYGRR